MKIEPRDCWIYFNFKTQHYKIRSPLFWFISLFSQIRAKRFQMPILKINCKIITRDEYLDQTVCDRMKQTGSDKDRCNMERLKSGDEDKKDGYAYI